MRMHRVTISFSWPLTAAETRDLLAFSFQVALITYLGLYVIEDMNSGFVTTVYDLNQLLWLTVGLGVLTAIWPTVTQSRRAEKLTWMSIAWMAVLGVMTSLILWFRLADQGGIRLPISILAGLIVVGFGLLVYFDRDEQSTKQDN